jgi:hypothetical protein
MRAFDFRPWHEMDMAGLLIMSVPEGKAEFSVEPAEVR